LHIGGSPPSHAPVVQAPAVRPVRATPAAASISIIPSPPATAKPHARSAPPLRANRVLTFDELAGNDANMANLVRKASRVADSTLPVLIQGPTGSGKECFARALHAASPRASCPFVAVNCAALPETLIESELFGYGPGAFTGAKKEGRKGKIVQSSGGTLFLDEIGDMPLLLQTRLLRVLEEQEVIPLGAEAGIPVDLRVVCASNQDLRELLAAGEFREDLYYRLNGIMLELPALAARTDKDVLIRRFVAEESGMAEAESIDAAALERLTEYAWPGNIRELRNVIRGAFAICDHKVIRLCDLPAQLSLEGRSRATAAGSAHITPPSDPLAHAERETLLSAIRACRGNLCHTAKQLGISRNSLYRKLKRHGIAVSRIDGLSVRDGNH